MSHSAGCVVKITKKDDELSIYTAHQEVAETGLPKPTKDQNRIEIKDEFGPAEMIGYVDCNTHDAGIVLFIAGIQLGPFYGTLAEGDEIRINIELRAVTGHVSLFFSNQYEDEFFTRYSLKVKLGGVWEGLHKISGS